MIDGERALSLLGSLIEEWIYLFRHVRRHRKCDHRGVEKNEQRWKEETFPYTLKVEIRSCRNCGEPLHREVTQ